MSRIMKISLSLLAIVTWSAADASSLWAQSGSRGPSRPTVQRGSGSRSPASRPSTTTPRGSGSRATGQASVAMRGYCAVCLRELNKWVKGVAEHSVVYDGQTYYFPGTEQKDMFLADPVKYAPVLGGNCAVCQLKMGQRVAGDLSFGVDHKGRYYFFANEEQRKMFHADPAAFENVDLAMGGYCPVCKVDMGQDIVGNPKFALTYRGMRYLFPGEEQMKKFQQNPSKYAGL